MNFSPSNSEGARAVQQFVGSEPGLIVVGDEEEQAVAGRDEKRSSWILVAVVSVSEASK